MSANVLGSPKANLVKEKVIVSYGSEKNLNAIKPIDRRSPNGRNTKLEEL